AGDRALLPDLQGTRTGQERRGRVLGRPRRRRSRSRSLPAPAAGHTGGQRGEARRAAGQPGGREALACVEDGQAQMLAVLSTEINQESTFCTVEACE